MNKSQIYQSIVKKALREKADAKKITKIKRAFAKEHKLPVVANHKLVLAYKELLKKKKIKKSLQLENLLKKSAIRTKSGVSIITVLTKPYNCPGNCVYCPSEPVMPKSYLSNEPAAQRAKKLKFNPIKMVNLRIKALEENGHQVDKIELLVLGGSFTAYTSQYQQNFIRQCFYATNTYGKKNKRSIKTLTEEQKINERAKYKIIGITLETRPDEITPQTIKHFRQLGCTRVQLGVQHIDNKILNLTRRGHLVEDSISATFLLKQNGFKVDHHYMPDLPGSTPTKDLAMMKKIYTHENFKPDQIKIYPCVVNEYAQIASWFKQKKYQPYSPARLKKLLLEIKKITPYWVRINRLIRDIPAESIIAGNKITNLRQIIQQELKQSNARCKCIRCREVGINSTLKDSGTPHLFIQKYKASQGTEYFISFESKNKKCLYAFLRLRINQTQTGAQFTVLNNSALVRELHVYGQMVNVGSKLKSATQHKGLGKKLMQEAEKIAKKNNLEKIAVISGVGVRNYYRKLGYRLQDTYMVKNI